jgi:hypothetical protein
MMQQSNWVGIPTPPSPVDAVKKPDLPKKQPSREILIYEKELACVDEFKSYMAGLGHRITNDSECVRALIRGGTLSPSLIELLPQARGKLGRKGSTPITHEPQMSRAYHKVIALEEDLVCLDRLKDYMRTLHIRNICDSEAARMLIQACVLSEDLVLRLQQVRSLDKRRAPSPSGTLQIL